MAINIKTQCSSCNKVSFTNFLYRMYYNVPFEGLRAIEDYDNAYLISVLTLDTKKYKSKTVLFGVASVKGMSKTSRYLNSSNITQGMIIHTTMKSDGGGDTGIFKIIAENIVDYDKVLELLSNFKHAD